MALLTWCRSRSSVFGGHRGELRLRAATSRSWATRVGSSALYHPAGSAAGVFPLPGVALLAPGPLCALALASAAIPTCRSAPR